MKTFGTIVFTAVLLGIALLSDGLLAVPAFAAAVFLWGIKI